MRHETLLIDLCDPALRDCPILKQGDTTRLDCLITKGNELFTPENCTVLLCATRADGMAVVQADDILFQDGNIRILLDPRIVSLPGTVRAELQFLQNGEVISSFCFTLNVQPSAVQGEVIAPNEESRFTRLILAISRFLDTDALPEISSGNLPIIGAGGLLEDSRLSPVDFAPAEHSHDGYASAEHIHGDPAAIPALSLYQTQAVNNGGYFTATTVQDILLEIGSILDGLEADLTDLL